MASGRNSLHADKENEIHASLSFPFGVFHLNRSLQQWCTLHDDPYWKHLFIPSLSFVMQSQACIEQKSFKVTRALRSSSSVVCGHRLAVNSVSYVVLVC